VHSFLHRTLLCQHPLQTVSIPYTICLYPQDFVDLEFRTRGYNVQRYRALDGAYHNQPTPLQLASYGRRTLQLIHGPSEAETNVDCASPSNGSFAQRLQRVGRILGTPNMCDRQRHVLESLFGTRGNRTSVRLHWKDAHARSVCCYRSH